MTSFIFYHDLPRIHVALHESVRLDERLGRCPVARDGLVDDWFELAGGEAPESSLGEVGYQIVLVLVAAGLEGSRNEIDTLAEKGG